MSGAPSRTTIVLEVLLSIVGPSVIYSVLSSRMPSWVAYLYSVIPVALMMLYDLIKHRRFGYFATPVTLGIVVQVVVAYVWGSADAGIARFCIVIPNIFVAAMWIGSVLCAERNAIAQLSARSQSAAQADAAWAQAGFRRATALIVLLDLSSLLYCCSL
ncbi:hypothetical protein BDR26DRAFT_878053 [Obelidium mucronatum]|nr:hypothetical protein BDR26DRAFT_878053 [Obelidium mucronatum]